MSSNELAPAGYRLGEPISLADFLALPPDGRRYARTARGRLTLMGPEDIERHRLPIAELVEILILNVSRELRVAQETSVAIPAFLTLGGDLVPESRLGPRAIEPDVAVYARRRPEMTRRRKGVTKAFTARDLSLAVEVLSRNTWRSDLGLPPRTSAPRTRERSRRGRPRSLDVVDRFRSYLASGLPELWVVNAGLAGACPLPPWSGLFLRAQGEAWVPLPVDDPVHAEGEVHGLRPLRGGRVRSATTGVVLDLEALWRELAP